ncbi:MAG TPA: hypothetical protein VNN25_27355 [Thermoanaerobaculia bacterium]|nr:hypothetical protein [Thermoanaerobaculia bacterium]
MSPKIIITTPFPTPEEVAAYYRIPAERVAELDRMIAEHRAEAVAGPHKKASSRNGGRNASKVVKASRSKK